jgi:hypothetical protein
MENHGTRNARGPTLRKNKKTKTVEGKGGNP